MRINCDDMKLPISNPFVYGMMVEIEIKKNIMALHLVDPMMLMTIKLNSCRMSHLFDWGDSIIDIVDSTSNVNDGIKRTGFLYIFFSKK